MPLIPRTCDCFVNLGTNRFNITANIASVDICGRMKELVVPWYRCSHFGVPNLTADSTSLGSKGGGRYRSMRPHCLGLRMLRGQRRTHIGMESSSLFSLNLLQYGVFTSIETYDNEGNMRNFWYKFRTLKRLLVLNLRTSMRRDCEFYIKILLKLSSISRCS